MADLALVMPMAGRGSRFVANGVATPKPLIEIAGKPFFWWAAESIRRRVPLREMLFVVLREHIDAHAIDRVIGRHYPAARIVAIDAPTDGAGETAAIGVAALAQDGPVAVNDCDHAFDARDIPGLIEAMANGASAALVGFASASPAYSYVRLARDDPGQVTGTVEKQVVSPFAIAGCYFFAGRSVLLDTLAAYRNDCPYDELFVSGLFNILCDRGAEIRFQPLAAHRSFGTPEELARIDPADLARVVAGEMR